MTEPNTKRVASRENSMQTNRHLINRTMVLAGVAAGTLLLPSISSAQVFGLRGWETLCLDPDNTAPYSTDYALSGVEDSLFSITAGRSGTVSQGVIAPTDTPPKLICFPTTSFTAAGGFSFGIPDGTLQAQGADQGMALT
ncbi:MAG: hypothetical protein ABUL72_07335, partial [Armatimonadota bacterium]